LFLCIINDALRRLLVLLRHNWIGLIGI
jgi:hypothetical protein